jgi:hypothetical protein
MAFFGCQMSQNSTDALNWTNLILNENMAWMSLDWVLKQLHAAMKELKNCQNCPKLAVSYREPALVFPVIFREVPDLENPWSSVRRLDSKLNPLPC